MMESREMEALSNLKLYGRMPTWKHSPASISNSWVNQMLLARLLSRRACILAGCVAIWVPGIFWGRKALIGMDRFGVLVANNHWYLSW